ncbi:hypothetical protein EBB07_17895 [Paenibacillaceae bacterium]|nr:hypothetical protein EBB07_17895 [Paenibacillaceae bacterium]
MAEPLKAVYNEPFLQHFASVLHNEYTPFNQAAFINEVMDDAWEGLELKARMRKISTALGNYLPDAYGDALDVLLRISEDCKGFPYLLLPDFVEVYGQADEHWELSINALEQFTQGSSAEFAVRPFILRDPERMMAQMEKWSHHSNEHVRRLASEGCRPRLPWGVALIPFKQDPAPILPILERLKEDDSLYVRKSVANNLNDIAKDHPDAVLALARRWQGGHPHTDWIIRHGCRTLIRQAVPEIMELFGYAVSSDSDALADHAAISTDPTSIAIGESCSLNYELRLREGDPVRIRIEYGIEFVKAGGKTSRKLFLLSDKTVAGGTVLSGQRTHRWADLTTRRHYPGEHRIALLVNGREVADCVMQLAQGNAPQS